ncbi:transposase [Streptomyces erythrochromogenes]|uniref:helix-turn-helix domain-containing protein n=1 Tax=Streptomyces erythrochromogenes TaxID=285574 RepID=UPI00368A0BB7
MSRGPRAVEVVLSDEERVELLRWAGGAVEPRLVERTRIVLACADGKPNTRVAAEFRVTADTVGKWRSRFAARRVVGLADELRSGRRKPKLVLSDDERTQLTPLGEACEDRAVPGSAGEVIGCVRCGGVCPIGSGSRPGGWGGVGLIRFDGHRRSGAWAPEG